MPTIASSIVPPPKSWDEFEDITLAAAKLRWNRDEFQRNGRPGQKQDGVDIFGLDDDDRQIGVQCKNTVDGVTFKTVESEITNAEGFEPELNRLCIATTAKRDAKLQKKVRKLSEERRQVGQFRVDVLFWDDVCQDLAKDDKVFFAHYPQFRNRTDEARLHDRELYDRLLVLLRSDGVIRFVYETNMAGFSFNSEELNPLREFAYNWNNPELEFISPAIDEVRKQLWEKANEYLTEIATQTFPTDIGNRQTVPPEWEWEQPDRFARVVGKLHNLAGEIVALHRKLVRVGRDELIVNS